MNYPIYSPYSLRRLRMILEALEVKKREKWSESKEIPVQLTVEHLLPQSWKQNWPLLEATEESIAKRNQLIQTIGNLTLLTDKLNPSISNGSWPYKTEKIGKFSVLLLNRNLPENWSETEILQRADDLFTLAQCIWPKMSSPPCVEPIEYRNMNLFPIGRVSSQESNSNKTPIPNVPVRWTPERLVEYFKDLPNTGLANRQKLLLDWANQKAFFKPLPKGSPRYGLQSKWGLLVIIYANGQLFVRLGYQFDEMNTRDFLVENLNELGLFRLTPEQLAKIRDGKYSTRTIEELSDEQFEQLKTLLEQYCR